MVFYFEPRGYDPKTKRFLIYMGKDKYENEELIANGLPIDIWFHVEDMSSAHVYLRLDENNNLDTIPPETLEDCAQLVKANSIQGHKKSNISVIYTPWSNLQKTSVMDAGAVGFNDIDLIRHVMVPKKLNEIINRLNRTKREAYPDLRADKEAYEREIIRKKKAEHINKKKEEKAEIDERKKEEQLRSYANIMKEESMVSSEELGKKYSSYNDYEDDFM